MNSIFFEIYGYMLGYKYKINCSGWKTCVNQPSYEGFFVIMCDDQMPIFKIHVATAHRLKDEIKREI